MQTVLPYIVSIIVALISGLASYAAARRSTKGELEALKEANKHDLNKLMEQHKVDIDSLERKHIMDIEKLNLEHAHQMELQEKESGIRIGETILSEAMKIPEVRQEISKGLNGKNRRK